MTEVETQDAAPEPQHSDSKRRSAPIWALALCIALGAVLGFLGGVLGSSLHPGATGPAGQAGPPGPVGPAGTAAKVDGLGVCVQDSYQYQDGTTWIDSLNITSPSKHADGTTFCSLGNYVPVEPQRP